MAMSYSHHAAPQSRPDSLSYPMPENVSFATGALTHIAIMPFR
jgi:hypothetical protein